ncbi:hypothetical protein [Actinomyces marmotae]|uniref:hypothetical protein n=1 Tax=Actinomyces marmotae TaxID=2737173 RepID=UPI0013598876|nr:hypothetical protein [Actinomyces marmotae]
MTTHRPDQPDELGSASTPEQTIEPLDSAGEPAPSLELPAPAPIVGDNGEIITTGGPSLPDGLPGAIPPGTGAALAARRGQEARDAEGAPRDGHIQDDQGAAADNTDNTDDAGQGFAALDEEALAVGPATYPMGRPASDPFRSDEEIEAEYEASQAARAQRSEEAGDEEAAGGMADDGAEPAAAGAPPDEPVMTEPEATAQAVTVPPPLPGAPIRRRSRPRDPDDERESTAVRRRSLFPQTVPVEDAARDGSQAVDDAGASASADDAGIAGAPVSGASAASASSASSATSPTSATSALTGGSAPTPGAGTPALRVEAASAPDEPEPSGSHWTSKSSWTPDPSSSPLPPAPPLPSSTAAPVASPEEAAPDWSSVIAPGASDGEDDTASAASPAAAPVRRRRRAEARKPAFVDEEPDVDDDVLLDGSTVVGKPASRFGAHWAGILIAVVLLPLSWFFGHSARHSFGTTAARNPEGAMSVNGVIVIALSALCLGIGLWMARRSSLGTILVGALTALAGIPGLISPAATHRVLEQALGAAADRTSLGKDLLEFLWLDLSRGTFLLVGIVVLMVGIVSHSARRAGRREQEVIDRVRKAS